MTPKTINVAVGSTNPVKIKAVTSAFSRVWPEVKLAVTGVTIPSGVAAQPLSDVVALRGAKIRANKAINSGLYTYGVGIEGGLQSINQRWFACGWVAVVNRQGQVGLGSSARIIVPPKMMTSILKGQELGTVVDHFFETHNAKQTDGHFGFMTNQAITRTSGYIDGVIMALARFLHPDLF